MKKLVLSAFVSLFAITATSCGSSKVTKRFELYTAYRVDAFGLYKRYDYGRLYKTIGNDTCNQHFNSSRGNGITNQDLDNLLGKGAEIVSVERDNVKSIPMRARTDMGFRPEDGDEDGYVDTDRVQLNCFYTEYMISGRENIFK